MTFVLGDQARDMSRIASDLGLHKEFSLSGLPTSTSGGGGGGRTRGGHGGGAGPRGGRPQQRPGRRERAASAGRPGGNGRSAR